MFQVYRLSFLPCFSYFAVNRRSYLRIDPIARQSHHQTLEALVRQVSFSFSFFPLCYRYSSGSPHRIVTVFAHAQLIERWTLTFMYTIIGKWSSTQVGGAKISKNHVVFSISEQTSWALECFFCGDQLVMDGKNRRSKVKSKSKDKVDLKKLFRVRWGCNMLSSVCVWFLL